MLALTAWRYTITPVTPFRTPPAGKTPTTTDSDGQARPTTDTPDAEPAPESSRRGAALRQAVQRRLGLLRQRRVRCTLRQRLQNHLGFRRADALQHLQCPRLAQGFGGRGAPL